MIDRLWTGRTTRWIGRVCGAVSDRVYFKRRLIMQVTVEGPPRLPTNEGHTRFAFADSSELAKIGRLSGESDEELAYVKRRLQLGDRLILGYYEGELAFSGFVMQRTMELGLRAVPISADRAYAYKLFTVPRFRGLRLAPRFYDFLRKELSSMGFRRLIALVREDNLASLAAHRLAGFKRLSSQWEVRCLGQTRYLFAPGAIDRVRYRVR
jgi:ribosomal protein S18 acetylase RimI-like enzyme